MKKYERLDHRIIVRVTQKDLNRIKKYSEISKMKLSEFIREALINYIPSNKKGKLD